MALSETGVRTPDALAKMNLVACYDDITYIFIIILINTLGRCPTLQIRWFNEYPALHQVTLTYTQKGPQGNGPFSTFFDSPMFSDCTLILPAGRRVSVHRIILSAYSEFFRAAFAGGFTESTTDELPLHFSDPANILVDVIRSLYEVIPIPIRN